MTYLLELALEGVKMLLVRGDETVLFGDEGEEHGQLDVVEGLKAIHPLGMPLPM